MASKLSANLFEAEVLQSDVPVLVDFYADWCTPCKLLAPVIDELAEQVQGAKVVKVNIEDAPELAKEYRIMSIPTLLLFKEGKAEERVVGVRSKEELAALLEGAR